MPGEAVSVVVAWNAEFVLEVVLAHEDAKMISVAVLFETVVTAKKLVSVDFAESELWPLLVPEPVLVLFEVATVVTEVTAVVW